MEKRKRRLFFQNGVVDFPGYMLWQSAHLWQRKLNTGLKEYNLTHTQFIVLASLAFGIEQGIEPTQANLAKGTQIDPMMTSNILRTLEKNGLITRVKHPVDTRAILLSITDKGYELFSRAYEVAMKLEREFFRESLTYHYICFNHNLYDLCIKNGLPLGEFIDSYRKDNV